MRDGVNMVIEKQKLRKEKKMCRDALSPQERGLKSDLICDALKVHPLCEAARFVYCYAPLGSEADIWPLVDWFWRSGRRVAFPRVTGDGEMEFFEVSGREALREGVFHVMEPVDDGSAPVDWEGALVLVPLVAFAADGTRCGYGKGYYDRYFALHPNLVRLGVGFSCQRCEELCAVCEESDERLDYVQTEDVCYDALQSFSYEEMADKICGSRRFGRAPGVECSRALMALLDHPEHALSFVHIAGTNGKGSVAAFLREICVQEGVRVGLFTSPHLQSFTERIQIGHTEISREDVLRLGQQVLALDHLLVVREGLKCTMFDLCLAIALVYYREQGVELVILETGMGGRLDSTNCIPAPLVTVITAIGLEHTEYLGDTLEKIAAEKAGILKRGTRAVIMAQTGDEVWLAGTERDEARLTDAERDEAWSANTEGDEVCLTDTEKDEARLMAAAENVPQPMATEENMPRTTERGEDVLRLPLTAEQLAQKVLTDRCKALDIPYRISGEIDAQGMYELPMHGERHYDIGMPGAYQRKNAAAALEAAELLIMLGEEPGVLRAKLAGMTPEGMAAGIAGARWPGRMEVVQRCPWVLLDGAHNAHGVAALAKSLRELDSEAKYIFFMGVMAEKNYAEMAELILPLAKHIYTLAPESGRALSAKALCGKIRALGGHADVCGSVDEALALIEAFPPEEKCVIFGSLYLIGEVRERFCGDE